MQAVLVAGTVCLALAQFDTCWQGHSDCPSCSGFAGTLNFTSNIGLFSAFPTLARTLDVEGQVNAGSDGLKFSGGTLTVEPQGNYDLSGSSIYNIGGTNTINITGTLNKSGSGTSSIAVAVADSGTIYAQAGTMAFNGGYTQTGGALDLHGGNVSSSSTST